MQLFEATITYWVPHASDSLTCLMGDFIEAVALKEIKLKSSRLICREFVAKPFQKCLRRDCCDRYLSARTVYSRFIEIDISVVLSRGQILFAVEGTMIGYLYPSEQRTLFLLRV